MNSNPAHIEDTKRSPLVSAVSWLRKELRAARPIFLFFFAGFMLVLMIVKLSLAQYSIEVSTLSRALIGALVAAKVTLILDETRLRRAFARYPRIIPISFKTIVYGLGVLVLGCAERLFDAYRHSPSLAAAWTELVQQLNLHRLLAVALGTSSVFAVYFVLQEITLRMGSGAIHALLFKAPGAAPASERASS